MALKAKLKGAVKSLTIWVNALFGTLVVAGPALSDQLPELQKYISEATYGRLVVFLVVLNIVIRFKTNLDLAEK